MIRTAVASCLALALACSAVPTASQANMRSSGHATRAHNPLHRLQHLRTMHRGPIASGGFYGTDDVASYADQAALEPVVIPSQPPVPVRHFADDRPTVEHTDVGVTIFRGPSRHF